METTNESISPTGATVRAHDISWVREPQPPIEAVDVLGLDEDETFSHARDVQQELVVVRALLHEALAVVQRQTVQLDRYAVRVLALVTELRAASANNQTLSAQLRALKDEAA